MANILARAGLPPLAQALRSRRLQGFGHLLRMPASRLPRIAMVGHPAEDERPRSRPPSGRATNWRAIVAADLKKLGHADSDPAELAQHRDLWRKLRDQPTTTDTLAERTCTYCGFIFETATKRATHEEKSETCLRKLANRAAAGLAQANERTDCHLQ